MKITTDLKYPDQINVSDAVRDRIVDLIEEVVHGNGHAGSDTQFEFEYKGSICDRELYSISGYTDTPAYVKIAVSERGRDANLVEAKDRELLHPDFRQHVIPVYDMLYDGRGIIQLNPNHDREYGDGETAIEMLTHINENTADIDLNIGLSNVSWYDNRPVLQHWGELRR